MANESTTEIIFRNCKAASVDPRDVFIALMDSLHQKHLMSYMASGLKEGEQSQYNVFSEIQNHMRLMNQEFPPKSTLHSLELATSMDRSMLKYNAKNLLENHNNPKDAAGMAYTAKLLDVFSNIERELMNQAENRAVAGSIHVEEMMKRHKESEGESGN